MRRSRVLLAGSAAALALAASLVIRADLSRGESPPPVAAAARRAESSASAPSPMPVLAPVPSAAVTTAPPSLPEGDDGSDHDERALQGRIAAIDDEIAARKLVERANAGTMSAEDHAALRGLLERRDALSIARAQQMAEALDQLGDELRDREKAQP